METYVKKLAGEKVGKKVKYESLAKKGFWIEDFNKKLYKIWAPVEEFEKGDVLKRVCTPGVVVYSNLYIQKPAYVSLKDDYANIFSFDEQAFFNVSEMMRKTFKLSEVKLPSLDEFPDNTLVERIHFWDPSPDPDLREATIIFDGPENKKCIWEEFKGTRTYSFTIQLNYKKNGLQINNAKISDTQAILYLTGKEGEQIEIDQDNELKLVKRLVKSIDEIYTLFEFYTPQNGG